MNFYEFHEKLARIRIEKIVKDVAEKCERHNIEPTAINICLNMGSENQLYVQEILGWPRAGWNKGDKTTLHDALLQYLMGMWKREHPEVTRQRLIHGIPPNEGPDDRFILSSPPLPPKPRLIGNSNFGSNTSGWTGIIKP